MFDRFRQQYPQGSIISDLVQIHNHQYVVKVSISSAGNILAATLAADQNLFVAEQQATERALAILGITLNNPLPAGNIVTGVSEPLAREENKVHLPDATTQTIHQTGQSQTVQSQTVQPLPDLPVTMMTAPEQEAAPIKPPVVPETAVITIPEMTTSDITEYPVEFYDHPTFLEEPTAESIPSFSNSKMVASDPGELEISAELPSIEEVVEPAVKNTKAKKTAVAPESSLVIESQPESPANIEPLIDHKTTPSSTEPPLSVTDMIPLINMELKRLGWSKERGRDYMVSLYNKRASALLSDEELFGLLQHLQAEVAV